MQVVEDVLENVGGCICPGDKKVREGTLRKVNKGFHGAVCIDAEMLTGKKVSLAPRVSAENRKTLTIVAKMNMEDETANRGMFTFAREVWTWVRLRHRTKVDMPNMNANRPGHRLQ